MFKFGSYLFLNGRLVIIIARSSYFQEINIKIVAVL